MIFAGFGIVGPSRVFFHVVRQTPFEAAPALPKGLLFHRFCA